MGVLVSVLCAMAYAMANISSRQVKILSYTVLGFYHSLLGLLVFGSYLVFKQLTTGDGFTNQSSEVMLWVVCAGICDWMAFNTRNLAF